MSYQPVEDLIEPDVTDHVQPNTKPSVATNNTVKPQVNGSMFRVGFYSRYFDINTDQFLGKIVLALNPLNKASVVSGQNDYGPTELYGFLWINATIVFLMFVSSTGANMVAQWLHAGHHDQKYEYDFSLLTVSVSVFYGYAVVVPFVLYVVAMWGLKFRDRLSLTRIISIYSYSGIFWVPSTMANVILAVFVSNKKHHMVLTILQWVLVGITGALSGLSIMLKIRPIIVKNSMVDPINASTNATLDPVDGSLGTVDVEAQNQEGRKQSMMVVGALVVAHLAFAVTVKIAFFGIQ